MATALHNLVSNTVLCHGTESDKIRYIQERGCIKKNVPGLHSLMPFPFSILCLLISCINELPNINSQMLGGQTKVLISFPGHYQILSQSGNEATKILSVSKL